MPSQDLRIPIHSQFSLAGKAWGKPTDGLPTLALHGWLDNAASFDVLSPELPSRYLVALDWPGHGLSDHLPKTQSYDAFSFVSLAFAAADALGWQEFHLLSHSLGACMAVIMAGTFPERVKSLVLLEGLGPSTIRDDELPLRYAKQLAEGKNRARKQPPVYASLEEAAQARAQNSNVQIEAARLLAARGTKPDGTGKVTWSTDPRLFLPSPSPLTEAQLEAFLKRILAPTLLIWADKGWPFDAAKLRGRQAAVPRLRTEKLQGSHHIHMEDPISVALLINDFWAKC